MTNRAIDNRTQLYDIRKRMHSGQLTYDQAKVEAAPVIARINEQAKAIAKKHGKRPQTVSFAAIMR